MAFNFQRLEHVRIALALVAAVITGGAALYGVYHNAREATAASYETLAPENQPPEAGRHPAADREPGAASGHGQPPARAGGGAGNIRRSPLCSSPGARRARAQERPGAGHPARNAARDAAAARDPAARDAVTRATRGAPAPRRRGGEIQRRVPIDFEKAREIWKQVKEAAPAAVTATPSAPGVTPRSPGPAT